MCRASRGARRRSPRPRPVRPEPERWSPSDPSRGEVGSARLGREARAPPSGKRGRKVRRMPRTGGAGGAAPSGGAPTLVEKEPERFPDIQLPSGGARHGRGEQGLYSRPRQITPSFPGSLRRARLPGERKGTGEELENRLQVQSPRPTTN